MTIPSSISPISSTRPQLLKLSSLHSFQELDSIDVVTHMPLPICHIWLMGLYSGRLAAELLTGPAGVSMVLVLT